MRKRPSLSIGSHQPSYIDRRTRPHPTRARPAAVYKTTSLPLDEEEP
jgi:hypothetical protein